ncbi:hypothetical protein F511_31160 [Dorcoceras hygrometricum]|uniref:Uncharacterized protein n=1 Tax=Dorcoceras hygrometricum TaxID=472368 RepID=A0A2Z7AN79_9LAMI|nr:hypothetical protein F511_31160 [Dorcoceras hygrometricum]
MHHSIRSQHQHWLCSTQLSLEDPDQFAPCHFCLGCSIQLTTSKSVRDALRSQYTYLEQLMMVNSAYTSQTNTRQQISSCLLIPTND